MALVEKIVGGALVIFAAASPVWAYVAGSSGYRLQTDSINFAGGLDSSSSYQLNSTLGEIATGAGAGVSYKTAAGYQQMLGSFISLSSPSDLVLSPAIGSGVGQSSGSTSWTVITDNSAGYSLAIRASTDPALQSASASFANYTPVGANPDFVWSVGSSETAFGFSPSGSHLASRYLDNGAACNLGALDTSDRCWDALTTSNRIIANSASPNQPSGTATTVKFLAEAGSGQAQTAGTYNATVIATAMAL